MDVQALQNALGHAFGSKELLQQALTHRSHSTAHNERLEFLGDSILNCVVASLLFDKFARIDEGDLSRLRANLVKQQSLYEIAQRLELSPYLRLGEGELKSGGFRRPSILADTVEALFGAVFLDSGFDAARGVIRKLYQPVLDTVDPKTLGKDSKTLLQEYLQGRKIALPVYTVVATHGAAHSQEFEVECAVPKLSIQVLGGGGSRRAAEQAAAKKALEVAQTHSVAATKKARRAKPAQLSLQVAVEQTAEPASLTRPSVEQVNVQCRTVETARDVDAAAARSDRSSVRPPATIEPARIVAHGSSRPANADGVVVKVDGRPTDRREVRGDARGDARVEAKAEPEDKPETSAIVGFGAAFATGARPDSSVAEQSAVSAAPHERLPVSPSSDEPVADVTAGSVDASEEAPRTPDVRAV